MHCLDLERGGRDRKQKRELRRNKKVESAELGDQIKFRRLRCYGRLTVGFWSHNNALHSLVLAGEKKKEKRTRHPISGTNHTEHSVSLLFGSQAGSK